MKGQESQCSVPRFFDGLRRAMGYRFPPLGSAIHNAFFRLLPECGGVELLPGIRISLRFSDLTQRSTYWQGSRFEFPTPQILEEFGRGAKRFFDIGSNYGFFSYWMLTRLPEIEVHSFEPNPKTFELIEKTKARNALDRLHPNHLGLSDIAGVLELHYGAEDSGHSTFTTHPELTNKPVAQVRVAVFDDWAREAGLPPPQTGEWVAKIDVEGFELKVLHGMRNSLEAKAFRLLAIEMNEFTLGLAGTTPAEIVEYMRSAGYVSLAETGEARRWPIEKTANSFFVPAPPA